MRKVLILLFRIGLGVIALVVLLAGGLVAYLGFQKRNYSRITDTHDLPQRIDKRATEYIARRKNVGLVVGVIHRGQRFVKGYGRVSENDPKPPRRLNVVRNRLRHENFYRGDTGRDGVGR